MDSVLGSASWTIGELGKTAGEARETISAMGDDVRSARSAVESVQPVMDRLAIDEASLGKTIDDVDGMVPKISSTVDMLNESLGHARGILYDGQKVSDKLTSDFMTPKPWWKKAMGYGGDTFDVLGLVARHVK